MHMVYTTYSGFESTVSGMTLFKRRYGQIAWLRDPLGTVRAFEQITGMTINLNASSLTRCSYSHYDIYNKPSCLGYYPVQTIGYFPAIKLIKVDEVLIEGH